MTVEEGINEKKVVEEEKTKKKIVLVGIRLDRNDRLLLNWALVKVAEPGDSVVAIHVCRDLPSEENPSLLDDYLEVYKGLCSVKQINLTGHVLRGNSVRKVLVREAKLCEAMVVVVGVSKQHSLRCWVSVANYCAKRLPPTTTVLAINNGKVVFQRGFTNQIPGIQGVWGPSLSLIEPHSPKENQSSFGVLKATELVNSNPQVVQNLKDGSRDDENETKHDNFNHSNEPKDEISSSLIFVCDDSSHENSSLVHKDREEIASSSTEFVRDGKDEIKHDDCNNSDKFMDAISSSSISGGNDTKHENSSLVHEDREEISSSSIDELIKEISEPTSGWPLLKKTSSVDELIKEISEPTPGWPLLKKASSAIQETVKEPAARQMSVVQWVMSLPRRTYPTISESQTDSGSDKTEILSEREILDCGDKSNKNNLSAWGELPKELELLLRTNSSRCRWFSHKELKQATSQFSSENLIAKGGSSHVYKGYLQNGMTVAVKSMKMSKDAWKDYILEVDIISSLKHRHIIPLIGVCLDDNDLFLVYDFFSNGSLEENLHGKKEKSGLSWKVRFNIAIGVAEAINYLHKECSRPVIHRDIKSSNILLSNDFEPQISDFGLALWAPGSSSLEVHSDVVGTFGYLAPEYFMYGKISNKIDVYSFGVVLLELISGRKPISTGTLKGQESLVMWAKPILESGEIMSVLDPNISGNFNEVQMRRMIMAINLCITRTARLRPEMDQILKLLRGEKGVEEWKKYRVNGPEEFDNQDDDEAYPDSSVESHLGLALLDVDDDTTSLSSVDQHIHHTFEDYLKGRCSRSSSFD